MEIATKRRTTRPQTALRRTTLSNRLVKSGASGPSPSRPATRQGPRRRCAPQTPAHVLPGLMRGASLLRPNARPDEIGSDVREPDDDAAPIAAVTAPNCRKSSSAHQAANGNSSAHAGQKPAADANHALPSRPQQDDAYADPDHSRQDRKGRCSRRNSGRRPATHQRTAPRPSASATNSADRNGQPESRNHSACAIARPNVSNPAKASGDHASAAEQCRDEDESA